MEDQSESFLKLENGRMLNVSNMVNDGIDVREVRTISSQSKGRFTYMLNNVAIVSNSELTARVCKGLLVDIGVKGLEVQAVTSTIPRKGKRVNLLRRAMDAKRSRGDSCGYTGEMGHGLHTKQCMDCETDNTNLTATGRVPTRRCDASEQENTVGVEGRCKRKSTPWVTTKTTKDRGQPTKLTDFPKLDAYMESILGEEAEEGGGGEEKEKEEDQVATQ